MKACYNLLLLLFILGKAVFAQPGKIITHPAEKQLVEVWDWYRNILTKSDSAKVVDQLEEAETIFAQHDKMLLRRQAWLLRQLYLAERNPAPQEGAASMLKAAAEAAEKGWSFTEAECWHHAGTFYYKSGRYGPAFEYLQKAQRFFETAENKNSPVVLRYTGMLGYSYYNFGEYEQAIPYFKRTIELPDYWNKVVYFPGVYNAIGLCYRALMKYDSAATWFNRSYDAAYKVKDSFYMALANGNLGYTYFLQHDYDKAVPLMETDYIVSTRSGEQGSAVNAAIALTTIAIKKGEFVQAENYMQQCRQFVYASGDANLLKGWYENLYLINKAKQDYKKAGLYSDSLLMYKDSVEELHNKKIYNQTVLKVEAEKYMTAVTRLENERKQQLLLRNSLLVGVLLLGIIAILWANRQLIRRSKEKELAKQQLSYAKQELLSYTQMLKEKNDLLEQLRNEIDTAQQGNNRIENINQLLAATILTDDDWKKFRELFEKVYAGFFIRLKEKMPDLSPADTRLLALTKLKLPAKDMAAMLGVSYDSIKKARQRLRKKINLPEEGGLEELAEMI